MSGLDTASKPGRGFLRGDHLLVCIEPLSVSEIFAFRALLSSADIAPIQFSYPFSPTAVLSSADMAPISFAYPLVPMNESKFIVSPAKRSMLDAD